METHSRVPHTELPTTGGEGGVGRRGAHGRRWIAHARAIMHVK